jgi:hypothetical protein
MIEVSSLYLLPIVESQESIELPLGELSTQPL